MSERSKPLRKPVLVRRPENWDNMTDDEKDEFAMKVAELMGLK